MSSLYDVAQLAFRDRVRDFLDRDLPADLRRRTLSGLPQRRDDFVGWQRILYARGWGAPNWPREFGGMGWTLIEQHIFDEECAIAGAPRQLAFNIRMLGPVLMAFGTDAQKARFLPRILTLDDWWCQGYSEPGAGSDLASLRTRGVRDGDRYRVTGQKIWTTFAHHANWMFCLVRTRDDGRPQQGISFLLIDMKSPGVTVKPIRTIDGEHHLNEVWLDDVIVPAENLVGEEHKGWACAKYLLVHERSTLGNLGPAKRELRRLKSIATLQVKRGRPLSEDPVSRGHIARLEINLMALEVLNLRMLSRLQSADGGGTGAEASIVKICGTELLQEISEQLLRAAGPQGLPFAREHGSGDVGADWFGPAYAEPVAPLYFNSRKLSIFGGTNQIQKNIVAKTMGL